MSRSAPQPGHRERWAPAPVCTVPGTHGYSASAARSQSTLNSLGTM